MIASAHRLAVVDRPRTATEAWLPRGGRRNGFDAALWAPLLDVTAPVAVRLLAAMAAAGVPARAAPHLSAAADTWRLWVATARCATAEQVLLAVMPDLLADHPDGLC